MVMSKCVLRLKKWCVGEIVCFYEYEEKCVCNGKFRVCIRFPSYYV